MNRKFKPGQLFMNKESGELIELTNMYIVNFFNSDDMIFWSYHHASKRILFLGKIIYVNYSGFPIPLESIKKEYVYIGHLGYEKKRRKKKTEKGLTYYPTTTEFD